MEIGLWGCGEVRALKRFQTDSLFFFHEKNSFYTIFFIIVNEL